MRGQDRLLVGMLLILLSQNISAGAATVAFKPAVTYQVGTTPIAVAATSNAERAYFMMRFPLCI